MDLKTAGEIMQTIDNRLISYSVKHPTGYTVRLRRGRLNRVKPSQKLRYCVASKTLLEIYGDGKKRIYFDNLRYLRQSQVYIGGYFNRQKGCYQVEVCEIYDKKDLAIAEGLHNKQISIYDMIRQKEIKMEM